MENLGIFFTSLKRKKRDQYLIQFQFVLLQIVSSSVLDQVSGIFFLPGKLLDSAGHVAVTVVPFTILGP